MQADSERLIYRQIADVIEDGILSGAYPTDSAVPSTNQFARVYQINPATAGKGVQQLVEEGILYKKRGLGMYVAQGAREKLHQKRKTAFFTQKLAALIDEAERLDITREEVMEALSRNSDNT